MCKHGWTVTFVSSLPDGMASADYTTKHVTIALNVDSDALNTILVHELNHIVMRVILDLDTPKSERQ